MSHPNNPGANKIEARERERSSALQKLRGLLVVDLKDICRQQRLARSGNKADLQFKIEQKLNEYWANPDTGDFETLVNTILGPQSSRHLQTSSSTSQVIPHPPPSAPVCMSYPATSAYSGFPMFSESPFYVKKAAIASCRLHTCANNRHEVSTEIPLTASQLHNMDINSRLRILVYCTDSPYSSTSTADVEFPSQLEMRVNGDEVKGSYKRVGKKQGSVKPADITEHIRKSPHAKNSLRIVYARTSTVDDNKPLFRRKMCPGSCKQASSQVYYVVIMLVEKVSTSSLIEQVSRRVLTKETVIEELKRTSKDADIEVGPVTMSLKDAASQMRIKLPVRGLHCTHHTCFDASIYLEMQEQAPLWSCPICSKSVPLGHLAVDQYFEDVLSKTAPGVDLVRIQPDGSWSPDSPVFSNSIDSDAEETEDVIELTGPPRLSFSMAATPKTISTATQPSVTEPVLSRGQKRHREVIDLTLSDDENIQTSGSKRIRPSLATGEGIAESSNGLSTSSFTTPAAPLQISKISFPIVHQMAWPQAPTTSYPQPLLHPPPPPPHPPPVPLQSPRFYDNLNGTNSMQGVGIDNWSRLPSYTPQEYQQNRYHMQGSQPSPDLSQGQQINQYSPQGSHPSQHPAEAQLEPSTSHGSQNIQYPSQGNSISIFRSYPPY